MNRGIGKRDSCLNFSSPLSVDQGSEIFPLAEIIKAWNRLSYNLKALPSVKSFKKNLKEFLLEKYSNDGCDKVDCYPCKQKTLPLH